MFVELFYWGLTVVYLVLDTTRIQYENLLLRLTLR